MAGDSSPGTAAAILGYPLDGPFVADPGRLGTTQTVNTEDAYGNGPVVRSITSLRGLVRPGNSGGPMVEANGHVAATVFAAITGGANRRPGGFAVPDSLVRTQLAAALARNRVVGTGQCAG
jgi:S1-C subfamily serine protease